VVRGPEWSGPDETEDGTLAGRRRHDRGRERRGIVQRRQQARDRPRQEGLPSARRSDNQEPMATGQGDFQGTARLGLAADLGQVRHGSRQGEGAPVRPTGTRRTQWIRRRATSSS